MKHDPECANTYGNIGAVYIATEQYEQAQRCCQKAVEMMNRHRVGYSNEDYAIAHANLAIAVGRQGQIENAKRLLKIAEEYGYPNGSYVRRIVGIKKGLFSKP